MIRIGPSSMSAGKTPATAGRPGAAFPSDLGSDLDDTETGRRYVGCV